MLFQITLESHGYTFVGKGTIDVFVSDLKHEGKVYNRLRSLQGKCIPVHLGNIDLVSKKWYEYGICILHMLLMSYGGTSISMKDKAMKSQAQDFEVQLDRLGVQHGDMRTTNMLWNQELQRLIFIDFERSTMAPPVNQLPIRVLRELSPNKRFSIRQSPPKKMPTKLFTTSEDAMKNTPGVFTIFDEENMTLQLPIPSPKRPVIEQEESRADPTQEQSTRLKDHEAIQGTS